MNIKKVNIDNKEIGLRVDGFSPILYKMSFKSDLFSDFVQSLGGVENLEENLDDVNAVDMLNNIDTTFFYKLLWLNAKSYDKSIVEFEEWLASFNYINIYELFDVLIELNFANLVGTKKK